MKTRTILALTLVLSFVLGGIAMASQTATGEYPRPMCQPGSTPDGWCIDTGDAYHECEQLAQIDSNITFDWAKRVGPVARTWVSMEQSDLIQSIQITDVYASDNVPRTAFDWIVGENGKVNEDDYSPVGAVFVKSEGKGKEPGGEVEKVGGYNIFTYAEPAYGDTGLTGYYTENGGGVRRYYQIDHITFCWTHVDENGNEVCYQEETAWGDGERYIDQGNWATYFAYPEGPVDILAGQYMDAGYLTFGTPYFDNDGKEVVIITVTLENGFVFYYDGDDTELDENLKVQDYDGIPLAENPAIGLFDWKESVEPGSTTAEITVPVNSYYGVHLDVAYPEDCPVED